MEQLVVSVSEMQSHENYTCKKQNITLSDLMDLVGKALFDNFINSVTSNKEDSLLVIAGTGNNGGDALVLARHLLDYGYDLKIYVIGNVRKASREMQTALGKIEKERIIFLESLKELSKVDFSFSYIIDGLFGTGLKKDVEDIQAEVIRKINDANGFVYSIDMPSGINASSGQVMNIAVKAKMTAVIQYYKFGNLLQDAMDYSENVILLDCGILFDERNPKRLKVTLSDYLPLLPPRKHNSNKYDYGNILIIGGHPGMMGAPQLSAISALKTGSGLVSIAIKKQEAMYFSQLYPEVMINYYDTLDELNRIIENKNVIVFGPGLGKENKQNEEILKTLLKSDKLLVIDADGLYYLKDQLKSLKKHSNVVITPHLGEMTRLFSAKKGEVEADPEKYISELTKNEITVVLKGATTIISDKDNMVFSQAGNPGMATAGSGDVLTGIIASFLGQGLGAYDASVKGVLIHSFASAKAALNNSEMGMIASDVVSQIPATFSTINKINQNNT